jgi:hypothetical protein
MGCMELRGIVWFLPIDKIFPNWELGLGKHTAIEGVQRGKLARPPHHLRVRWDHKEQRNPVLKRGRGRPRHTRIKRSRSTAADRSVRSTRSVEFEGDELGFLLACVGQGVGVAAGEPLYVAGFDVSGHGALAFDIAADVEIGECYHQMRS